MEKAHGIRLRVVGAKGVGADQLRAIFGLVRVGFADRAHLVKDDLSPGVRRLPCRFGAGEPCADDMYRAFSLSITRASSALIWRRNPAAGAFGKIFELCARTG